MAKPKILCPVCAAEINPGDKFCGSCGSAIEWDGPNKGAGTGPSAAFTEATLPKCPLCGYENPAGASTCASCGAALPGGKRSLSDQPTPQKPSIGNAPPAKGLQAWKFVAGAGLLIILILVGVEFFRTAKPPQQTMPPGGNPPSRMDDAERQQNLAVLAREIDSLQKKVDANPQDASTLLHLANLLQDAKISDRAIDAYKKYLALKPNDADATVDMGVSYYEFATADSAGAANDLKEAQNAFMHALSIQPRHQMAHFNLGIVSLMSGDMHSAGEWFKKCAAIDSTTDIGRRAQTLLTQHSMTSKP